MLPPIGNHYSPGMVRPCLNAAIHPVHLPTDAWNYHHHPFLIRFRNRFFLCFSSGTHHEDDVGQRVLFTSSSDFLHWDEAKVLAQPHQPQTQLLIPQGVHQHNGLLVVYYMMLQYSPEVLRDGHRQMGSRGRRICGFYYKSSRDGIHWSEETPLEAFGGNMPVRQLQSGRLFSCGGRFQAYTDDPSGLTGWHQVEVFPEGWGNHPSAVPEEDDMPGLISDTKVSLCEASCIQQDGGDIYLYFRSATPWLWASRSSDDGESWTLPERTDFTDNRTKFFMDRLPDGRYYYIGTPDPFPPRTRHVLALSLSRDGLDWTEHYLLSAAQYKGRYPGIDKNGVYGYPSALVEGDTLYVAFSICKEAIAVLSTDLKSLQARR